MLLSRLTWHCARLAGKDVTAENVAQAEAMNATAQLLQMAAAAANNGTR